MNWQIMQYAQPKKSKTIGKKYHNLSSVQDWFVQYKHEFSVNWSEPSWKQKLCFFQSKLLKKHKYSGGVVNFEIY